MDPVVGRTDRKTKICFCMLQGYIQNTERICRIKVRAGNVSGLARAKDVWAVRASVPAVCEFGVADDDTGHKCYIISEKNKGWRENLRDLWFSWDKARIIHHQQNKEFEMQLNSVVMFIPASSQRQSRKAVINFGSPQNLLQMSGASKGAKIEAVGKICQKE